VYQSGTNAGKREKQGIFRGFPEEFHKFFHSSGAAK
jgi:hypothetical protein